MSFAKIRKGLEKDDEKLHKERLDRCRPVAREVSALLEGLQLPIGDDVQNEKAYEEASIKVLQLFLDRDVRWVDREFIFQLALQPMSFVKEIVSNSLQNSWNQTITGLFGKKTSDLTMADVDNAMKKMSEEEAVVEKLEAQA
jgi:hypothetical protein